MPMAQQFLVRVLTSAPRDVAGAYAVGALQSAVGGGGMGAAMEAAQGSAHQAIDGIQGDLPQFACGALRVAAENTPVFGAVFRLGESALGRRMCESDDMTVAERQSLARGAVIDLAAPGASAVMSAIEMGASKQVRPLLEMMAPGVTKTEGYQAYASALRADDPDRAAQLAAKQKEAADAAGASVASPRGVPCSGGAGFRQCRLNFGKACS
jgi:hypothetical protein